MALDAASERMTVRQTVDDLRFSELWAPPEVAEQVEIRDRVTLYLDIHGRAVGWRLPDKKIGVREDYR